MRKKYLYLTVCVLSAGLILSLAFSVSAARGRARASALLEEHYRGALLSALEQLETLKTDIDKALISRGDGALFSLYGRIESTAAAVSTHLGALPLAHAAMGNAAKLCNQVSDYAQTLLKQPDANSEKVLRQLSQSCAELKSALSASYAQMQVGSIALSQPGAYMADADAALRPLEGAAGSLEYPTLIYDGPFSDVISESAPRALGGEEISSEQALALALSFVGAGEAHLTQESGGPIPAFGAEVVLDDCVLQLAVTKRGGEVLWMFPEHAEFEPVHGLVEARAAAEEFLISRGFLHMEMTFWQLYGGMATLSYAYAQGGVLMYPDLIKVQVRLDTLQIVGWEARHYLSSHYERADVVPVLDQEEAQGAVSGKISISGARLCVIPLGQKEVLAWEFQGEYLGDVYYVYIDAKTGQQRDIQRLVQDAGGLRAG